MHVDNKKKDILIVGLDDTTFTAEAKYSINFSKANRKFYLSLYYNVSKSYLFANATKIYEFKAKDSEIKKYPFCLRNISGGFSANIMKKTGLNGCVYYFSVDHRTFDTSNFVDIHKHLIKKHNIK